MVFKIGALSFLLFAGAFAAPARSNVALVSRSGTSCSTTLTPSVFSGEMWIGNIQHNGTSAFGASGYTVYRDVMSYGCKGDGVTDDTACINAAISAGNRCGNGCGESTTTPALVYFPAGKYLISSPIILYYYTQMVGNALNPPTLIMAPAFQGIGLIDSDPYVSGGQWYGNTNNFYRQVRNFIIDLTQTPATSASTGIHWQVAQATSLTNIVFQMSTASNTAHQGVWMENGSGGFISDLVFNGGKFGIWVGNQQFTSRNLTMNNCQTAVYMNWNWAWTFKTLNINNCNIGLDMSAGGSSAQTVGSVTLLDVTITNTPTGVLTGTTSTSQTKTSGSLILDNVNIQNVPVVVKGIAGNTILAGSTGSATVASWGQGSLYTSTSGTGSFNQNTLPTAPTKGANLLASNGKFFERPRPQYENYAVSDFVSVKAYSAKGDGNTDDTAAIQNVLNQFAGCKIIYFPAGTYIISSTVTVPAGSRIVGEGWSVLMASGTAFSSSANPTPMLKVGNSGDTGTAEISDLMFSTKGAQPGAILVQWNIRDPSGSQGVSGMWDSHFRIGGAAGTNLQSAQCPSGQAYTAACQGAYMHMQLTASSSAYLENVWAWTADHDLDGTSQTSIYTGRGILIESTNGPVWMYGTASEHNVLYQYQVASAKNILMAMIQTETPYYQPAPPAPQPFPVNSALYDPTFSNCASGSNTCSLAWGLRVVSSSDIYVYGAGLYNFFYNYNQTCLTTENCQDSMVDLENNTGNVYLYNLNTKAATNMVVNNGNSLAKQADNTNGFCSTINAFLVQVAGGNSSGGGSTTTGVAASTTTTATHTTTAATTTAITTTTTTTSSSPTTTSSNCGCANGLSCCGGQCYDTTQYSCFGTSLCPAGDQICGAACYSTSAYSCSNGSLVPV